jgi:hypothetical protein
MPWRNAVYLRVVVAVLHISTGSESGICVFLIMVAGSG